MGNDIAKLFGIEKEEKGLISILLIQSVFLGTFYGVFNITAHSLFLAKFDEILMARAYILSGLVGIGLTYIYTLLQSRLKFNIFSNFNILFVLLVTVSLWFLITVASSDWVIFAIFIMMGPLNLLALLSFYGTTGRLFTLRQGRRLFGFVDTGIVVGVIISSFSIPALLSLNVTTSNILLLSVISIFAALLVQITIGKRYSQVRVQAEAKKGSRASLKLFREDKYVMSMGMFIALSVVVAFFIQYSFMAVTRARYPLENDLASFLGLFEGSMMVFTLLIKTFIFSYLIKNYGLKLTLAVGPVLVGVFVVIAVIIGSTMGYLPETAGFMIFFLILALARLFSKAMKDSLETPAFKVLYQTLGEKVRYNVQSAIDGTVNEIAALTSGLLLTGLGALAFIKLIHFSWVLAAVVVLWILSALRLYTEYRKSVRKSIDADDSTVKPDLSVGYTDTVSGVAIDISNNYYKYICADDILSSFKNNKLILDTVLNYAELNPNTDLLRLFEELTKLDLGSDNNKRVRLVFNKLNEKYRTMVPEIRNSGMDLERIKDRKEYINSIFASGEELVLTDLLKLIRDKDFDVRREAIFIVGRNKVKELLPDVCDSLNIPQLSKDAYFTLRSFGQEAFEALSTHYFRSAGNIYVRILIIRLFGEAENPESCKFLLPRLWSVHRDLRKEALKGLKRCDFQPDQEQKDKLIQEIQEVVGFLTWNIAATVAIRKADDKTLLESLNNETAWWSDFLFGLLSIIYDKKSFDKIRSNLESGTVESVNLALEMIDIVVDDAVKPRLTSLLDVVSEEDKLKSLFQFYPGEIPDYQELVVDLINTDYNRIGVWTKSCALKSLYNISDIEDPDFVVALLFSPNKILREEALRYLQAKFDDVYSYCAYRVPDKYRDHLSAMIDGEISAEGEIFTKINFLTNQFENISMELAIDLSMNMKLLQGDKDNIKPGENYIIWYPGENEAAPAINWKETNHMITEDKSDHLRSEGAYFLNIKFIADAIFDRPDEAAGIISYLEKNIK